MSTDVVVAGAGALGLSVALALADAGCRVTVSDPAPPGRNASGVAAGMLAPAFETVLDADGAEDLGLLLAARDLWPSLAARAGVELERSGAIAVGAEAWLDRVSAGLAGVGLNGAEVGRATLDALAPGLAAGFDRGVMSREDWRLDPGQALAVLRRAAQAAGVEFRSEPVKDRGDADLLVVATGAAQGLAPEQAQLSPIKGHILRATVGDVGRMSVRGEGGYVVPVAGGVAVGATMEPGVTDPAVDQAKAAPLRAVGARLFPELAKASFELSAGVRATTADGLPLVGLSSQPGVLLAAGARRNGWLLAPLVAQVMAACVTGRDPGPYAAALDPRRFEKEAA